MLSKIGKIGQLEANQMQLQAQLEDKPSNISLQFMEKKFDSYATKAEVNQMKFESQNYAKKSSIKKIEKELE